LVAIIYLPDIIIRKIAGDVTGNKFNRSNKPRVLFSHITIMDVRPAPDLLCGNRKCKAVIALYKKCIQSYYERQSYPAYNFQNSPDARLLNALLFYLAYNNDLRSFQ
jgi:hypothetical protein